MRVPSGEKEGSTVTDPVTCLASPNGESWHRANAGMRPVTAAQASEINRIVEASIGWGYQG